MAGLISSFSNVKLMNIYFDGKPQRALKILGKMVKTWKFIVKLNWFINCIVISVLHQLIAAPVQNIFAATVYIKSGDERNLHHGDGDITGLFDDHGLICCLQFGRWVATVGEISAWCGIRGAAWQTLQSLHVLLLDGLLLRDRNSLDFNLQHRAETVRYMLL